MNKATLENNENFTGTHSLYDLTGKILEVKAFEDGEVVSEFSQDSLSKNHLKYAPPIGPSECAGCGWVLMRIDRIKDWYHTGTDINGNFNFNYTHSSYDGSTSEWVYVYNPGGYNEGYGDYTGGDSYHEHYNNPPHGPAINENPHNYERVEDKIDATELEGKAECIYNKFNIESSSFKNIIKNFDGDFPVSHLKFSINNFLPSGNYGVTKAPENYWINIEMSNTQLSKISDLGSATAFTHEVIHAEIYRKMLSAAKLGDLDPGNMTVQEQVNYVNSLKNDFPGIYDYYINRYKPTWNHNMMAEHYINIIADAIQEFDNFNLDRRLYEEIAWAGLRNLEDGTTSLAWNSMSDSDKQRILKNLSEHFFNGPSNCN